MELHTSILTLKKTKILKEHKSKTPPKRLPTNKDRDTDDVASSADGFFVADIVVPCTGFTMKNAKVSFEKKSMGTTDDR